MCELLGYSGSEAGDLSPWLAPFRLRGGQTGDNPDGWGVAAWNETGFDIVKSPEPGHSSEQFAQLAHTLRSRLLIAHVRKARHPPVPGMLNTHPFRHNCCNRPWVFAHNGLVPEVIEWHPANAPCKPLGDTDSEHAFCHLLTAIADSYANTSEQDWIHRLAEFAEGTASLGKFNFLLSDGSLLIAYGHDRLHHMEVANAERPYAVIATEALSPGNWQPFAADELRIYRDGMLLARRIAGKVAQPT
ncbi:glutamine amidotransferase [Sulfuritortus calidifontis]|uniref:Glutamine amidotransferase n=1 Tax=Sulfuritortus calidifontis TaxID=1914471 RepID=A0A4R3JYN7_9PROT|nr:class II glutamine amidotransferase [Sulfuritortus calidifontis]TCS72766.1 glutamine amidotransferase [Sulfuritortus calidifontis]